MELYKTIKKNKQENAFLNVEESVFRILLTLMVTNSTTERSFSQLKHEKKQ